MRKRSLLQVLVDRYPADPKDELYARVLCGEVLVDGERIRNPKAYIEDSALISFLEKRYVSRGGIKLEHALSALDFVVERKVILDAGSSTGGFTDCLLQHGASHVHAVDVGTNQLAYALRENWRVSVHENTNIMALTSLDPRPHLATADISFRSIRGAASKLLDLCSEARALVLIKPQFEWSDPPPEFDGVVRNPSSIRSVLLTVANSLKNEGIYVEGVTASPIAGRKGNREYFFLIGREASKEVARIEASIERQLEADS